MAKKIQYRFLSAEVNLGTREHPYVRRFFLNKTMDYSVANEELAKQEAYQGEYTVTEEPEEIAAPTRLDTIEAQLVYTAMMTDTLLEV